jgi:uncharacterized zinc-type alcohol dehydrogenase-like protein
MLGMNTARAYGAEDQSCALAPMTVARRDPTATDVQIDVLFCGVCHSDLHTVRSEWSGTVYPCVPGHEVIGRVTAIGRAVKGFAVGQLAGVGCMVDSCATCRSCRSGLEQFCETNTTWTYNSPDAHGAGPVTYGGYSSRIVVDERFCLRVSDRLDPAAAAPLLCAGITLYSPLKHWNAGPGKKVGIVGLGGLGHMGVKFAHHFGAHTVTFTTSARKIDDARRLGADEVVLSHDASAMQQHEQSFDLIVDTVSASHNLDAYTALLKRDGTLVLVGVPELGHPSPDVGKLIMKRRRIGGSLIGGIPETQEMLDFSAERGIVCDVEVIPIQDINRAYERMLKSDVKYRFVIDMATV